VFIVWGVLDNFPGRFYYCSR